MTLCVSCHSLEPKHTHVFTKVQKEKISKSLKGKTRTKEQIERIRRSHIGQTPWNKGISIKSNNALEEYYKTNTVWNKGIKKRKNILCVCGKSFHPPKESSKYCSKSCASKGNKKARKISLKTT